MSVRHFYDLLSTTTSFSMTAPMTRAASTVDSPRGASKRASELLWSVKRRLYSRRGETVSGCFTVGLSRSCLPFGIDVLWGFLAFFNLPLLMSSFVVRRLTGLCKLCAEFYKIFKFETQNYYISLVRDSKTTHVYIYTPNCSKVHRWDINHLRSK